MIEQLVKYENNQIGELNLFDKRYGLAEIVEDTSGNSYPLVYESNGNLKHVTKFSDWLGMSYFRLNGTVQTTTDLTDVFVPCSNALEIIYPLKFVGTIKRTKLITDDAYSADRIIQTIKKKITTENSPIRSEINASRVSFKITGETFDRKQIISEEYAGIDKIQVRWEYIYISLNIEAKVFINKNCIQDYCGDLLVDQDENQLVDQNNNPLQAT